MTTTEAATNELEEARLTTGLARSQFLRLIGLSPVDHMHLFETSNLPVATLNRARRIAARFSRWAASVRKLLAAEPLDAWQLGQVLGVSGWWVAKQRTLGFLTTEKTNEQGNQVYGPEEFDALCEANRQAVIDGRRNGPLAYLFLAHLQETK